MESITSDHMNGCRDNGVAVIGTGIIETVLVEKVADSLVSSFRAVCADVACGRWQEGPIRSRGVSARPGRRLRERMP
jgi:hypothetical protein